MFLAPTMLQTERERNLSLLPLPEMAETPHRLRNNVSDKARILFTPLFTRGNVLIPMFLCSESPILIPMFSWFFSLPMLYLIHNFLVLFCPHIKGQLILEWLFGVFNFLKIFLSVMVLKNIFWGKCEKIMLNICQCEKEPIWRHLVFLLAVSRFVTKDFPL